MRDSRAAVLRSASEYGVASALALVGLCLLDSALERVPLAGGSWALLLALASCLGMLHGAIAGFFMQLLAMVPHRPRFLLIAVLAIGVNGLVVTELGAPRQLNGAHRVLALRVIVAGIAGALALFALLASASTGRNRGQPDPRGSVRLRRSAKALLLAGASIAALCADLRYYPHAYPIAHAALRVTALWSGMFALAPLLPGLIRRHARTLTWLALASVIAVPLAAWSGGQRAHELALLTWAGALYRGVDSALDVDRDGYAPALSGDCQPFDPRINPGAREIPGNGIDDNCMLGDASPPRPLPGPTTSSGAPPPLDIVLITVDSLRPDHLGLYNRAYGPGGRATTPNLDRWAARGVVFDHAYTPGGWTSIAIASIMRGVTPRRLRWRRYFETFYTELLLRPERARIRDADIRQMFPLAWQDPTPTLAARLHARGMRTLALVDDGFSRMLTRGTGIERDFDHYRGLEDAGIVEQSDRGMVQLARFELSLVRPGAPLFLWLHFFGPHSPNETHPGSRDFGPSLVDGYDSEIAFFDSVLPELFALLDARPRPTAIILTGDHGEEFAPPERMHGFSLGEEDIRVPLIVHVPGLAPRRVEQLVSTLDLLPTVLGLTGTPLPAGLDGEDLMPLARGERAPYPRTLISESWRYSPKGSPIVDLIAAFDGRRKIVHDSVDNSYRELDQRELQAVPQWVNLDRADPLLRKLRDYIEVTGGILQLSD